MPARQQRRALQVGVAAERADAQRAVAVLAVVAEAGQVVDVDEQRGGGEAQLEQRHEALAAREHLGVVAVLGQERDRLVEGARRRVAEAGGVHQRLHVRVGDRHREVLVGRVGAGLLVRRPRARHRLGRGLQVLRELGPRPDRGALPGLRRVLDQLVHAPVRHPPTPPRACGGGHCARFRRAAPMVDKRTIKRSCSGAVPLVTMGAHVGRAMQVPAPFEYHRATSVEHAIGLLVRHGPETRLVAGGHSLIPMMKLRLAAPELLVDINELTDLAYVTVDRDVLRIGALTRHAALLAAPAVGDVAPVLHDAERSIADAIVRNRGTVGGSVCQADPSEDLSGAFCALRAEAVIRGAQGTRTVPMREFFLGPVPDGGGARGDARGAARAAVGHGQRLRQGRPAGGGLGGRRGRRRAPRRRRGDHRRRASGSPPSGPSSPRKPRRACCGRPPTEETFAAAGRLAAQHCRPSADQRGPVDYKRHLAGELTVRALAAARRRRDRRCASSSTGGWSGATSSRGCCSCTCSATSSGSPARTGAATRPTAGRAWCGSTTCR